MFAVYAESFSSDAPLDGLVVGERPDPEVPDGWTTVTVKAASLNHHDLWSLRGVGLREEALPMILGCDAAGLDEDGNEVVVHAVISSDPSWTGDETLDPRRSLLSERHQGTFADKVAVPRRNVVPKPASLSFEEAACLPTAWLTAYRMLFTQGGLKPGDSVLVQGAGGGVATALITLARAGGLRVWATSRDEAKRARALEIGAHEVFESNARLPGKVDAVMETVGPRHLVALDPVAASGRHDRHQRYDERAEARRRRADPDLLPPAARDRLDHGHPSGAGLAWCSCSTPPAPGRSSTARCRWSRPRTASPRWPTATCSARSSSPADGAVPDGPRRSVVVGVVEAGQPGGQPLDGDLEVGVEVDELLEPVGEPGEADLLVAAAVQELLDAAVGEVHVSQPSAERVLRAGPPAPCLCRLA